MSVVSLTLPETLIEPPFTTVLSASPPDSTDSKPLLPTVVLLALPRTSIEPLLTTVPLAVPPSKTDKESPLLSTRPLETTPELTV